MNVEDVDILAINEVRNAILLKIFSTIGCSISSTVYNKEYTTQKRQNTRKE